jgi:hypothetical protein
MFPSVIPKAQCKSTIDRHRAKVHQNCKIDTARFKEGKRRRDSRPGEGLRDTRHSASCWIKMGRSSQLVARRSRRQRSRTVAKNLKASVRLIPAKRRCHLSVRNSARSELEVSVKPPTRLPAWTFIIQVYGGGSLGPTAVVIANLGKSRTSVAEFPANYCHIELFGGERRCRHIGRYAHCENCECQNGSHCSLC